jgi:hypothetical protein
MATGGRAKQDDAEARNIFAVEYAKADGPPVVPCCAVSDSIADTIADVSATVGASELVPGPPTRRSLVKLLRGNIVWQVADVLPDEIQLLIAA